MVKIRNMNEKTLCTPWKPLFHGFDIILLKTISKLRKTNAYFLIYFIKQTKTTTIWTVANTLLEFKTKVKSWDQVEENKDLTANSNNVQL